LGGDREFLGHGDPGFLVCVSGQSFCFGLSVLWQVMVGVFIYLFIFIFIYFYEFISFFVFLVWKNLMPVELKVGAMAFWYVGFFIG
jgi:hypothetical protein